MTLDEAKGHLKDFIDEDGNLLCGSPWVSWDDGDASISLDGHFDANELEAMAIYMRSKS